MLLKRIVLILSLLTLVGVFNQPPPLKAAPPTPIDVNTYYPLRIGSTWMYGVMDLQRSKVWMKMSKVVEIKRIYGENWAIVETYDTTEEDIYSSSKLTWENGFHFIVLMRPTQEGQIEYADPDWFSGSHGSAFDIKDIKETGLMVHVLAGEFRNAVRTIGIQYGHAHSTGVTEYRVTKWYAPGVGMVKEVLEDGSKTVIVTELLTPYYRDTKSEFPPKD